MDEYQKGVASTATLKIYDASGALTAATGTPTVAIVDAAGVAVTPAPAVSNPSTGVYTFPILPSTFTRLDAYKATWSATVASVAQTYTTWFELVGGMIVELADIRAFNTRFADTAAYPAAAVVAARNEAQDRFEQLGRVAFRPRARRVTLDGSGTDTLIVPAGLGMLYPRTVYAASVDGVAFGSSDLAALKVDGAGRLVVTSGVWTRGLRNVALYYEHGLDVAPRAVQTAVLILAEEALLKSKEPRERRATSVVDELGTFRVSIAGRDGPTGIPDVDAALEQYAAPGWLL